MTMKLTEIPKEVPNEITAPRIEVFGTIELQAYQATEESACPMCYRPTMNVVLMHSSDDGAHVITELLKKHLPDDTMIIHAKDTHAAIAEIAASSPCTLIVASPEKHWNKIQLFARALQKNKLVRTILLMEDFSTTDTFLFDSNIVAGEPSSLDKLVATVLEFKKELIQA